MRLAWVSAFSLKILIWETFRSLLNTQQIIKLSPAGVRYVWLRDKMQTSALRVQRSKLSLAEDFIPTKTPITTAEVLNDAVL